MSYKLVLGSLNVLMISLCLLVWVLVNNGKYNQLDVASIIGLIGFNLMWVHYVADAIFPGKSDRLDKQYIASRILVLFSILIHPFLVNLYLVTKGFGLPPTSYSILLGPKSWVVILGIVALFCFLLFEFRGKLGAYKAQILHANNLAMLLIFIHGFMIGMIVNSSWYRIVWWAMLLIFGFIMMRHYMDYYKENNLALIGSLIIVTLLILLGTFSGLGLLSSIGR